MCNKYHWAYASKWRTVKYGCEPLYPVVIYSSHAVYPKKYAHGFVVLCFVVVMQSFIMNSHEVFIISIRVALLALGQSLDCHSASEVSLMDIGNQSMYNHNKAQQSKNRVHISWDILYIQGLVIYARLYKKMKTKMFSFSIRQAKKYILASIYCQSLLPEIMIFNVYSNNTLWWQNAKSDFSQLRYT